MKYKIRYNILFSLVIGYIVVCGGTLLFLGKSPFMKETALYISLPILLGISVLVAVPFFVIFALRKEIRREFALYAGVFFTLAVIIAKGYNSNIYFAIVMIAILALFAYSFKGIWKNSDDFIIFRGKNLYISVGVMTAFAMFMVAYGTIMRYRGYNSSTFDLGIFTQMFESMATDFTQNTTLERNVLLSHFAVHFSPIYYLLLPFYMIFRSPEFLLTSQAVIVFSGVLPLLLICKRWRYSNKVTFFICGVFLSFSAFTGGCFYDFHENAFLVPLLLWLFYFLEKNSMLGMDITAVLILLVKEDAGLYLIIIGVYAILNRKIKKLNAIILLLLGVSGFIFATTFIDLYGEGIKASRYAMFMNEGEDSLVNVVVNVVKNPSYLLSELVKPEKIVFILEMLVPLLFLPFRTRKLCDYVLLVPMLLVNLATSYGYQYSVEFQYAFASGVCLVFLFAKNIRYSKEKAKTAALAFISSLIVISSIMYGRYQFYNGQVRENTADIAITNENLSELDKDAVILCTTYLTPQLYDHKYVYMFPCDTIHPDYVVLDSRSDRFTEYDETVNGFMESGYEIYKDSGFTTILISPDYVPAE